MTRSFAGAAVAALLLAGSSTAAWAGCACTLGNCGSGFSNCYFDDGGNCWTVSGRCLPKQISMIPGAEVITLVYAERESGDTRFAFAGCSRTLTERSYTAAQAEALREATRDLSL